MPITGRALSIHAEDTYTSLILVIPGGNRQSIARLQLMLIVAAFLADRRDPLFLYMLVGGPISPPFPTPVDR
jgi:hypothetical protein